MKNIISLLIFIVAFSSCDNKKVTLKKVDTANEKEAINNVLDAWHKSAAEANFETYFEAMTKESIFIGTDALENWKNTEFKEFSKPYFDKGKAWSFTSIERNIYLYKDGKVAWFDELLETHMGICRGSGVITKNENNWNIEHYVLSLTIPNDNIDDVIKINKEKDSLFLSQLKR
ncbi:nuclear transport factor 2 family protein [uncultured Lutibacter sp.]|uniref:nuclear transport factor 2 family protein n=1 Tax=uncultured Lutibacter sp. TaxID=437739 RepID=UPI002637DCCA|nr:nuclear transport factor 2 family protein [uncultured Lutibacter sp.]